MDLIKEIIIKIIKRNINNVSQDQNGNVFLILSAADYRRLDSLVKRLDTTKSDEQS